MLYIVGQLAFNEDHGFFTIASMISAFVATIGAPIMRTLNFWNFRLARSEDGKLRIRHGLLTSRSQVVPVHRIQSLTLTWPLLWRAKAWLRVTLAVAGQSSVGSEGGKAETDRLLPVATLEDARAIMPYVMPGVDPANLPMTPVPRKVRWLAPLRARVLAAGLSDEVFGAVDGFATRTLTIVPYGRIQSVRLTQGPWQRRLGVATVHADVAGSTPVSAAHRPVAEARAWARDLAIRSHAARTAAAAPPTALPPAAPPTALPPTAPPPTALPPTARRPPRRRPPHCRPPRCRPGRTPPTGAAARRTTAAQPPAALPPAALAAAPRRRPPHHPPRRRPRRPPPGIDRRDFGEIVRSTLARAAFSLKSRRSWRGAAMAATRLMRMERQLGPGLTASVALTVSDADTAVALRSGDVPVLGTPRVVALVEEATVAAVAKALEPGQSTVGVRVELDHLAATPVGRAVTAQATLTAVQGRKLAFDVVLHDGDTVAAKGTVQRVVIDRQRFLERL